MADAGQKRIVGLSLFASALVTLVLAALIGARVLPIAGEFRFIVASVLVAVAAADVFIGLRFIQSGE